MKVGTFKVIESFSQKIIIIIIRLNINRRLIGAKEIRYFNFDLFSIEKDGYNTINSR